MCKGPIGKQRFINKWKDTLGNGWETLPNPAYQRRITREFGLVFGIHVMKAEGGGWEASCIFYKNGKDRSGIIGKTRGEAAAALVYEAGVPED